MIKTVPADFIGQENVSYSLLALLSESTQSKIVALLNDISSELPGVLWLMPPEQMHITLCEIIQPKTYSQDKDALFGLHRSDYENMPARVLSSLPKCTITFDILEASAQAIIIRSSDATRFNSIRAQLVKSMPFPTETRTPPDIIHSSIARYLKAADLEKVQEVVARHKIQLEEQITEFKLLRNQIQPLQKYEVLRTYPLV